MREMGSRCVIQHRLLCNIDWAPYFWSSHKSANWQHTHTNMPSEREREKRKETTMATMAEACWDKLRTLWHKCILCLVYFWSIILQKSYVCFRISPAVTTHINRGFSDMLQLLGNYYYKHTVFLHNADVGGIMTWNEVEYLKNIYASGKHPNLLD